MTLRYSTPNLSSKGVRHDGYYMRAEKVNPKNYKYQPKEVIIPDSLYWCRIFYNDNTYCEFSGDAAPNIQEMNISYWGVYTIQNNIVKSQYIDPSINGGGVAERVYKIAGDNLISYTWFNFKSGWFGSYKKEEVSYDTPQVYRFVPSSILPPPNSWLKKEKWMYE